MIYLNDLTMEYSKRLKIIANNLRKSKRVNSFDNIEYIESESLAHSFLDIEESFKVLLDNLFPKLESSSMSEEQINDLLFDIGEEMRHILYHIKTPKFYEYLTEDS